MAKAGSATPALGRRLDGMRSAKRLRDPRIPFGVGDTTDSKTSDQVVSSSRLKLLEDTHD